MPSAVRMSEAAALALHAVVLLASRPGQRLAAAEIASQLQVSEAHLAKVLQRLAKAGLVRSVRGPKGGFVLGKPEDQITLLDAYEAIEGRLSPSQCLLHVPTCGAEGCIFGALVGAVNATVRDYLANTRLDKLNGIARSE